MKRLLLTLLLASTMTAMAQDQGKKPETRDATPRMSYRLVVNMFELENNKRINERSFQMVSATDGLSTLDVGTRVPVTYKEGQSQYMNVGVKLECRLRDDSGKLFARMHFEITSFAMPEQGSEMKSLSMPVLRNYNGEVETQLTPGKPQIIASLDDVNSKKRVQIELTATRVE